jgi:kynureninase
VAEILRKHLFQIPQGMIYLDGNSLGPMPHAVPGRMAAMLSDEWGQKLIGGWNGAGWMDQPSRIGTTIAGLIGAAPGSVVLGDTLSIKVYQALASALRLRPDRRVVLSDTGNFPTDLYMAQGLLGMLGQGYELRTVAPEDVMDNIGPDVAAVMLTHVDYRSGRIHDMNAITASAQAAGAVMIWDLAHSAGALSLDLAGSGAEFAVGCTYKYLNGGPGAPAFIYVRPDLSDQIEPALSGWLGHRAPFAVDLEYAPGRGIERMRVGTPPVLQMTALETALAAFDGVDMAALRQVSIDLQEQFIKGIETHAPQLTLASPRDSAQRGSQVSFSFDHGYAAMQAVIAQGVIGDFRAPDIMRFGFTPLYIDADDVAMAVDRIAKVMSDRLWDRPEFHKRSKVT